MVATKMRSTKKPADNVTVALYPMAQEKRIMGGYETLTHLFTKRIGDKTQNRRR